MSYEHEATQLEHLLNLKCPPIAVTFRKEAPAGVDQVSQAAPSGCTYWKLAAEGEIFYTEASDHLGCPIGSYTHGVDLSPAQGKELEGMIGMMVGLNYLRMEEVPGIPRREESFGVAIYAPLAKAPLPPDVVIVRGNAKQLMLLTEAANAAGIISASGIMGRPTCAMIPAVMKSEQAALSLGCVGNRVYTEMGDNDLYAAIPASKLNEITQSLDLICKADSQLRNFHENRADFSKRS